MAKVREVEGNKQGSDPLAERPWPDLVTLLELEAVPQTEGKPILGARDQHLHGAYRGRTRGP